MMRLSPFSLYPSCWMHQATSRHSRGPPSCSRTTRRSRNDSACLSCGVTRE